MKTVPSSMIMYEISKEEPQIAVTGTEFSRDMKTVFGGPDNIRIITFPKTVTKVKQGAFHCAKSLKSVVLNEGLEKLGEDEHSLD